MEFHGEYQDKGMQAVYDIPFAERISRWPWILDKRVRRRYLTKDEEREYLEQLVCLKCGKACRGACEG
ncbi:MAG: hypothetical protein N2205_00125 [Candidatus Caldatribacterium sp.]|uniref:hypothetical protein n=1 Tax=Candidatus Caldatribacterium sp. TaxID=2282143 RepID=UPI0029942413|nr:hypothetical protein [Candidatus Caldatribacterium sp.]MCX7729608.1 hypothetical protein [Candidatus Caldatribacterium sp.]MDW8081378.1 hypothetical protein [Candidatus Calescibacterium sp.]